MPILRLVAVAERPAGEEEGVGDAALHRRSGDPIGRCRCCSSRLFAPGYGFGRRVVVSASARGPKSDRDSAEPYGRAFGDLFGLGDQPLLARQPIQDFLLNNRELYD